MTHEKIFKREDGSRTVMAAELRPFGGRYIIAAKWEIYDSAGVVADEPVPSQDEILAAKTELWQKLKPE